MTTNIEIFEPTPEQEPKWRKVLRQIGKDMRHEIDWKLIDRLWEQKLKSYPDSLICAALLRGQWTIFPNVNELIEEIQLTQDDQREERRNDEWEKYKAEQKAAAEQGLLATEADYAEMNAALKRIAQSAPMPAPVPKPTEAYTPPPPAELERRKQEQLRAVFEKYGNRK